MNSLSAFGRLVMRMMDKPECLSVASGSLQMSSRMETVDFVVLSSGTVKALPDVDCYPEELGTGGRSLHQGVTPSCHRRVSLVAAVKFALSPNRGVHPDKEMNELEMLDHMESAESCG